MQRGYPRHKPGKEGVKERLAEAEKGQVAR
jgi:hypothetical protein